MPADGLLRLFLEVPLFYLFEAGTNSFVMLSFHLSSLVFLYEVQFQVSEKTKIAHNSLIKACGGPLESFLDSQYF